MSDFSQMKNTTFLNGNRNAIITFIVTMCLAVVLIFSGIIVSSTGSKSDGSIATTATTIYDGDYETLKAGKNTFKFTSNYSGTAKIELNSYSSVDSIVVTETATNSVVYSTYNVNKYTHSFSVYGNTNLKIEIKLESGASNSGFYFYYDL